MDVMVMENDVGSARKWDAKLQKNFVRKYVLDYN